MSNLKLHALYESVPNHRLLRSQWRLVRPSQILDEVLTSLYLPASGTSGVWPFLQALALTLPTAPLLYLTRVRPRSLLQRGPRYIFKSQAIAGQTTDSSQAGRAIAALLSLPIKPEGSNKEACLENFKNKVVYINSFTVSQKDMLESALRVTGTKEDDWTIAKEPAQERYSSGIREIQEGKRIGFAKMMYTRVFYPDGCGDFEHNKGTLNSLLDLPKENIDEATKAAIERSKISPWGISDR